MFERALALDPQECARDDRPRATALIARRTRAGATIPPTTSLAPRKQPTPPWPFAPTIRRRTWQGLVFERKSQMREGDRRGRDGDRGRSATMRGPSRMASFLRMYLGRSRGRRRGMETALRLSPHDPAGAHLASPSVLPLQPSGAMGTGDRMVRQVIAGDHVKMVSARRPRRRQRLGRP